MVGGRRRGEEPHLGILDGREPTELLDDLRSFARRRPGMFLAGSVIAGVVVGRFLRGSREAAQKGSAGSQYGGPTHVAVTQDNPLGTSYDATMTAEAPIDPLTAPLASPAVTSAESERPVGGGR